MPELESSPDTEFNAIQREVLRSNSKPEFRAAVGLSREWDARKAGREVARDTLEKLGTDPDFFLLFSTIHYEKWGGFKEFLDGVWEVLPKGTPLIGGTVAGFINPQGCFTRGATAMAVSYPNMDVAVGVGRNTRRNPRKAAEECAKEILKKQSKHKNKILLDIMPGPTKPTFFGIGSHWVTKQNIMAVLGPKFLEISVKLIQKGQGLEDNVVKNLARYMKDYVIFGGSSGDNNDLIVNYQFSNNIVSKYSLVGMSIVTDLKIDFAHADGMSPTGIKFKVTKTAQGSRIIKELDNISATNSFFDKIGISRDRLDDRILRTTFFYPLGFRTDDGYICPNAIGAILKDYIALNYSVEKDEIELFTTSGNRLIGAVNDAIGSLEINNPKFGFIVSCLARLEALGVNVFKVREILLDYFKETPFLLIYSGGENIRFPNENAHHFNETFNILVATDNS